MDGNFALQPSKSRKNYPQSFHACCYDLTIFFYFSSKYPVICPNLSFSLISFFLITSGTQIRVDLTCRRGLAIAVRHVASVAPVRHAACAAARRPLRA